MRTPRSYQREIKYLKEMVRYMQWVKPCYNGSYSCSFCGSMRHWECTDDCLAAKVTGDRGKKELWTSD